MSNASVYILRCSDGSFYTGVSRRLVEARVSEHNPGLVDAYTARRLPVTLIYCETYERFDEAVAAERRIEGWSRAKTIAYMRGDFDALHAFARRRALRSEADPSSFDSGAPRPAQDEGS